MYEPFSTDRPKKIHKKGQVFVGYPTKISDVSTVYHWQAKKNSKNDSLCHIFYKMQQFINDRQTKTRKVFNFVMYSTL